VLVEVEVLVDLHQDQEVLEVQVEAVLVQQGEQLLLAQQILVAVAGVIQDQELAVEGVLVLLY
jgi:hypothetical protein